MVQKEVAKSSWEGRYHSNKTGVCQLEAENYYLCLVGFRGRLRRSEWLLFPSDPRKDGGTMT